MSPLLRPRRGQGPAPRWPLWRGADLRVSDAERAEAADRLSKHYSDGRLDEATFNERLDQAMRAVTQSDLAGLLADLPDTGPAGRPSGPAGRPSGTPRNRPRLHRLLFLAVVVVIAVVAGQALARALWVPLIPWLLIGLVAFIWLQHAARRHEGGSRSSGPGLRDGG